MGSWPFTRLHFGCGRCIAISGPHIQVFDAASGEVLAAARCANAISCSAVGEDYVHLVTTGNDKKLCVWKVEDLQLKGSRELPKKATAVQLSPDKQTIIVADKFGDVFSYPVDPPIDTVTDGLSGLRPKDAQASHENPHGSLVLGHASIITSLILSHDCHYIITADRDEHIRVSRYPNGYNIERYCLGHQLFISTICIPTFEPSSLVSGGGDPYIYIWDWMSGNLEYQIPIADVVRPFLKVRGSGSKRRREQSNSGARGRRGRGRGKTAKESPEDLAMEVEESSKPSSDTATAGTEEGLVFALAKVETFEFNSEKLLIFSAIGGSALFYCTYPSKDSNIPSVRHIDFSSPVLDFVLKGESRLLVSVDAAWSSQISQEYTPGPPVRLIEWVGGELNLVEKPTPLLTGINGVGSQAASAAELLSFNPYSDLTLLPKNADGPDEGDEITDQVSDRRAETPESFYGDGKVHAKAKGRMRTKQMLLRKQLDKDSSHSASGDEQESKKIKLDESGS